MASIKLKFRPSTVTGNQGTLYYQIIHKRRVRQLISDYRIFPTEWDEDCSTVSTGLDSERKRLILSIRQNIKWDMERLSRIDRRLDADGLPYTADDVVEEFLRYTDEYSMFHFMEKVIVKLKENGKVRTAETYRTTLNSFRKFRNNQDLMIDSLSSDIMEDYEAWHKEKGNAPNTISFYTRILRAVYNRAVEQEIIENRHPFRHVYTGIDKTVKRALPLPLIRKIKKLDLSRNPALDYARDMFIMSFYLRGMSFIDMAYLRKTDLKNGYVTYRRRKTGQQLIIEWTKEMQVILNKYPENCNNYLLPIIRKSGANDRGTYRNTGYNINRNLKKIAVMTGISIPLTLYVARHSWASAAKSKGIPLSVISEGMGHESETTTRIYLASLDTALVDKANALILKSL